MSRGLPYPKTLKHRTLTSGDMGKDSRKGSHFEGLWEKRDYGIPGKMGHTERVRPGIENTDRFFLQSFVIPSFSSFPISSNVFLFFSIKPSGIKTRKEISQKKSHFEEKIKNWKKEKYVRMKTEKKFDDRYPNRMPHKINLLKKTLEDRNRHTEWYMGKGLQVECLQRSLI